MSLFKNVNVVSIHVKDWEGAKKFYREVLGWPVQWTDDTVGWEEYGLEAASHVSISRWDGPGEIPPQMGRTTLVLTVADAYKTVEELRAKGIKCDDAASIPGVVSYGTFYDPEGNRIQFAGETPPPA